MEFSPDGRYLMAFRCDLTGAFGWDLFQNKEVVLNGKLRDLNDFYLAFLSKDRVALSDVAPLRDGSDFTNRTNSDATIVAFPSGAVLTKLKIPPGRLFSAADPDFLVVRPF
jgi:hypothetical protein